MNLKNEMLLIYKTRGVVINNNLPKSTIYRSNIMYKFFLPHSFLPSKILGLNFSIFLIVMCLMNLKVLKYFPAKLIYKLQITEGKL
jgi:hypothetical protein